VSPRFRIFRTTSGSWDVLFHTGMRPSEVSGLRMNLVDRSERTGLPGFALRSACTWIPGGKEPPPGDDHAVDPEGREHPCRTCPAESF
jgi:hypothetical protein